MKPVAFVFPGQGSQSVGMLDAWGGHFAVRETLAEASEALHEDLAALIHAGPKETLDLTVNTQPAMLAADIAIWRVWRAEGGGGIKDEPVVLAGHSLGEYAALVAAETLPLAVAVPLVRLRAQAMQDAVPVGQGAMAAIVGLDSDQVQACCAEVSQALDAGEVVEAVNFNDPIQTVIAGTKAAVEKACIVLKGQGARRALPLPVSAPFHSSLMKPAAEQLEAALAQAPFAAPKIPVVNNIDVAVENTPARIRDALYRQIFGPVRWVECVRRLKTLGAQAVVECGPGRALAGMTKRIDAQLQSAALHDPVTLAEVKALLT